MRRNKAINALILPFAYLLMSGNLCAAAAKDILISPQIIHISLANEVEPVYSSAINGPLPGFDLSASSETTPGVGLTYLLSEKLAIETFLALPTSHDITITGLPGIDRIASGDMLPLVAIGQYHHTLPESRLTFIGGVGVFYAMFQDIETSDPINQLDSTITISIDDVPGVALQAGIQYKLDDKVFLRATYSKLFLEIDLEITTSLPTLGNLDSTMTLDPDVFMVGFTYKL